MPPIISFTDQELAALRSAAAKLLPGQRDRFLKDVANELGRCRKLGPSDRTGHTVAQVATAIATAIATAVQRRLVNDNLANGDGRHQACPAPAENSRRDRATGNKVTADPPAARRGANAPPLS